MKRTVDEVAMYLNKHGIESHAMHGDMYQNKRNKVIEQLRAGNLSVLVASDLASRGLDVEGITHVINYDLPEDPDLYVHRVGRTARAGRDGVAWALVTPEQGHLLTQIERLINAEIPKLDYPDFTPGPLPRHIAESRQADERRVTKARTNNRFTASAPTIAPAQVASVDRSKFPGGVVPSKLPDRRLGGRVKTARSMRSAAPSPAPAPDAPTPPPAK
jgi:superfamily II DNA/RNA helicase